MNNVPTVEEIMQINGVTRETAEKVVGVLSGKLNPCEVSPKCEAWVRSCYHTSDLDSHEVKLQACNELLDMCGIEALNPEGASSYTDEGIRLCPPFSYLNAGDTYNTTLARDHKRERWVVACWGDLLEEVEKEEKIGDWEEWEECPDRCVSCHAPESVLFLTHFPNSGRGDSYSWVCNSCNHHHFAVMGFEPTPETEVTEDD